MVNKRPKGGNFEDNEVHIYTIRKGILRAAVFTRCRQTEYKAALLATLVVSFALVSMQTSLLPHNILLTHNRILTWEVLAAAREKDRDKGRERKPFFFSFPFSRNRFRLYSQHNVLYAYWYSALVQNIPVKIASLPIITHTSAAKRPSRNNMARVMIHTVL